MNDALNMASRPPISAPAARLAELLALAEADAGSDARKSGEYALEAADLAQALGDRPAFGRALFLAGRCADYLLDQETALSRYRDALAEYEAIGDALAQAKTLRAIGFVYDSLGDFPQAIDYELKALALDEAKLVCARAWQTEVLLRDGQPVQAATATAEHGVFAFLLGERSRYSLRGACALVENPAVFTCIERLKLPISLAIYGHGRASNRLLDWLAGIHAPDFTLLHLPDYDPVGLSEFARFRARLGKLARLHLPADLPARFERFSNRSLLEKTNSRAVLANLRRLPVPEIRKVLELIDRHNAGLEQEALLLELNPG